MCIGGEIYYFPFREEYKYRYSGILYDKLKHLMSYYHRETRYTPDVENGSLNCGICRYFSKTRIFTEYSVQQFEYTNNIVGYPITVVTNRTFNFIYN